MHSLLAWLTPARFAELLAAIIGAGSVVTGLVPSRWRLAGRALGAVVRVAGRVSAVTHPDQPGTYKLPFLAAAVARAVADELDPPLPAQPAALDPKAGEILR